MAETPPPAPPIPRSTIVCDLVTETPWALRRNRFYFTSDNAPTGLTDLEHICNRVMAVYSPLLKVMQTTQVKQLRVEGRWYGPGTTGWEANSTSAAVAGTLPAVTPNSETDAEDSMMDTLPDEVCLIIQKRTGNTGRSKYGRWFFTGLSEKVQNAGQVDQEMIANAKTLAASLSDDITVSTGFATVLHARHWDKKNNVMLPITKCYVVRAIGTRKDRRRPLKLERA